jgi:hypothetical protein
MVLATQHLQVTVVRIALEPGIRGGRSAVVVFRPFRVISPSGGPCLIAGYLDGRLALLWVAGDRAERLADLPEIAIDVDGPARR